MSTDRPGVTWVPGEPAGPVGAEPIGAGPLGAGPPDTRVGIGPADLDTDGDGVADTVALPDGPGLALHTDLDGDGLADQVLLIGPGLFEGPAPAPPAVHEVIWWAPWTWFPAEGGTP